MYDSFPFLYYKFLSIQKIFKYIKQRCNDVNEKIVNFVIVFISLFSNPFGKKLL